MSVLPPPSPAERVSTPVDGVDVLGALSPSRAADFLACPLRYRFRTVDRLPEPPSPDAVRGTVVHRVLEELFDLPAVRRTPEEAGELLLPAWERLRAEEPDAAELFPDAGDGAGTELDAWLASCRTVLERYFTLEDPTRLEPAERELYVETLLDSRLLLRGYVDRLDVAADGRLRVVDYKGLALDTPLPTPTGWTTIGEVQVGEAVLGSEGRPVTITAKSGVHDRPCYRVTFRDRSSVVCDNVHLWQVVVSHRQRTTTAVVDSDRLFEVLAANTRAGRTHSVWIDSAAPLVGQDEDLPVAPWVLGAWLGDGDSNSGRLTAGYEDAADMLALVKEHWPRAVLVRPESSAMSICPTALHERCAYGHEEFKPPTPGHPRRRCAHEHRHRGMTAWNVSLSTELARLGLRHNKHIPPVYLRAGLEQRTNLLRGLMDTDGWWNATRQRAGYTTTDDRLARDVIELLRTLGIHPLHFEKDYTNPVRPGRTWHVIEFTPRGFNPFSLPRKASACDGRVTALQAVLARRRIVTSVERVPSQPTQCIAVDAADSLFLCGSGFVPTHNTGRSPSPLFEAKALFQMKFYALVLWRLRGVVPTVLQLVYLGNGEVLSYEPDEADLRATERKVEAIWRAIRTAEETGEWQPSPGRLCDWCAHRALCPAWGGTPPPLPGPDEVDAPEVAPPDLPDWTDLPA